MEDDSSDEQEDGSGSDADAGRDEASAGSLPCFPSAVCACRVCPRRARSATPSSVPTHVAHFPLRMLARAGGHGWQRW
jgi:hypothetical protein